MVMPRDVYETYMQWINNADKGIGPDLGADHTIKAYMYMVGDITIPDRINEIIRKGTLEPLNMEEANALQNWIATQDVEGVEFPIVPSIPDADDTFMQRINKLKIPLIVTAAGFLAWWWFSRRK